MAREMFAHRIEPTRMDQFVADFASYRLDEVLGAWKPYVDVLKSALRRTCKKWGLAYSEAEGQAYYDAVPSWGPHADVAAGLARIAPHIPLVILSNASNEQIQHNVARLGAPFHAVFTAEQAGSLQARMQAFSTCSISSVAHRGIPARLVQSALRPDDCTRPRHREQGVREPRTRSVGALLRVHRDRGHQRIAGRRRSLRLRRRPPQELEHLSGPRVGRGRVRRGE